MRDEQAADGRARAKPASLLPDRPTLRRVDLRSDNASQPSDAMRAVMSGAAVGDEAIGEDPTVSELERRVASLLGKDAAVFMPSGTMCNIVAYEIYCARDPRREILVEATSHPVYSGYCGAELGRPSLRPVPGRRGVINAPTIREECAALRRSGRRAAAVSLENTHNRGGGAIWGVSEVEEAALAARENGAALHLDGARLPNAVVASGVSALDYCSHVDSAWIDLSKGLGCPSGAVMAGDEAFVHDARRWKVLFGGGLHKAGILAAAGIHALDNHWKRLAVDHERARDLADGVRKVGLELVFADTPTNIVYFDVQSTGWRAAQLAEHLHREGVAIQVISESVMRAVTHLGVSAEGVTETLAVLSEVVHGRRDTV